MPYEIRKFPDGYKVCKKETDTCFSNKPIPLKNAVAQRKAIGMSGGEMSGGAMVIKAPKYGKIEIGIPSMYYKDKLIDSLTRLKALTTRKGNKSIILEETNGNDIIIENDGTPEKGGVAFHSIRIKVPKTLIKIKVLKKGEKEVEVPTLTNKTKNLTTRTKIRSIKFKTVEGEKVKVITNEDNVDVIVQPSSAPVAPEPVVDPVPPPPPMPLIKTPKNEFEEEVNKLIKFSLGSVNFDEFSRDLIDPDTTGTNPTSGMSSFKSMLYIYYFALKYKMPLINTYTTSGLLDGWTSHMKNKDKDAYDVHLINLFKEKQQINIFNEIERGLDKGKYFVYYIKDLSNPPDTLASIKKTIGDEEQSAPKNVDKIVELVQKSNEQVLIYLSIGSGSNHHAILLGISPRFKEVWLLDPHGTQAVTIFQVEKRKKSVYGEQERFIQDLIDKLGAGYTYVKSEQSCPYVYAGIKRGFQSLENIFQRLSGVPDKDVKGFCGYWTMFLLELILQNPNVPIVELYSRAGALFTSDPAKVFKTIVKYQANISIIINDILQSEGINLGAMIHEYKKPSLAYDRYNFSVRLDDLYKNNVFQRMLKVISDNLTRIYLLQKSKLGYGATEDDISSKFHNEDLRLDGSGISANSGFYRTDPKRLKGGDYFDDEDWNAIVGATKKGGDIDWWGMAKDVGSDLLKQGSDYITKLVETPEQKEARIKKEEACKLCNGSGMSGGVRPFFGRMGGKSKIAKKLIDIFPDNYKTFVEPFVGAGNIFWRLDHKPNIKYVINDFDPNVVKIFRSLKKGDKCLEDAGGLISQAEFNKLREKDNKTGCEQATYVRNSFFSMGKSYSHAKDIKSYESERLKEAKEILKNVTILNKSFEKVIKEYDSATTFFYLDPPYESESQKDYDDYVTPEQVYNGVKGMKGRFMISYNDSPNIRKIFKEYNISFTSTEYAHTQYIKKRKIGEVIITNYATKKGGDIDWSALGNIAYDYLIKPNQKEPQKLNKRKEGDDERNWGYDEEETLPPEQPHFIGDPTQFKPQPYDPNNPLMYMGGECPLTGLKPCKCPKKGGELYAKDKYKTGEKKLTPTEKKLVKKEMGEGNPEIEEIQREPMGDDDIKKYFPQAKILKYSELRNYSDIKQLLPKLKSFFFLLYERSPNVGHWVLVSRYNDNGLDTVEFFCSYGSKVDQPLTWTPIGMRVQLGEDKPLLSQLLDKSNLRVIYNPVQYQSKRSNIATCGAYDTLRASELIKHNTTLQEFNEMLSEVKKGTGLTFDEIVSNLIDMR